MLTERERNTLSTKILFDAKQSYRALSKLTDDILIVQSGNDNIGGIALQVIDKNINSSGKHDSVMLDFGTPMNISGRFFNAFAGINYHSGLRPLLELSIIPPIPGIYREDLPNHPTLNEIIKSWQQSSTHTNADIENLSQRVRLQTEIDHLGVFASHYHWDHIGNIGFLKPEITLYVTETTHKTIKAMEQHWGADWTREVTAFRRRDLNVAQGGLMIQIRNTFIADEKTTINAGDLKGTFIPISHSAIDAHAIDITTSSGNRIHYTGDIRLGDKTQEYISWLDNTVAPDVFILDGTNVGNNSKDSFTEEDVKEKIYNRFKESPDPFFITVPQRQFERVSNILEVAKKTGRIVYIPLILAFYIHQLQTKLHTTPGIPKIEDFIVYLQPKKSGSYSLKDYPTFLRNTIEDPNIKCVYLDELKNLGHNKGVVIFTSQDQINQLKAFGMFPRNGHYIHSSSDVHDEKGRVDVNQLKRILSEVGYTYERIHASGHFSEKQLMEFLKHVRSKLVLPIHTENPRRFGDIIQAYCPNNPKVITSFSQGLPYTLEGKLLSNKFTHPV